MSRFTQNFADAESAIMSIVNGASPNGRVDLLSSMPTFEIPSFQQRTVNNTGFAKEATTGQLTVNTVSELFFSKLNIDALQQGIRYRVYVETNGKYVIGRQSDQDLKIVMRSIYLQFSKNNDSDCVAQVRSLNAKVLEWVIPEVLSNLLQYSTYRRDASTLPMPLDRSPNMSTKGTFAMELTNFM